MAKPKSRPARWAEAVSDAREALETVQAAAGELDSALEALREVQSEYTDWRDNLPESLQGSALGEKLSAVADLDLEPGEVDLSGQESAIDEAEGAELPLGFGRD